MTRRSHADLVVGLLLVGGVAAVSAAGAWRRFDLAGADGGLPYLGVTCLVALAAGQLAAILALRARLQRGAGLLLAALAAVFPTTPCTVELLLDRENASRDGSDPLTAPPDTTSVDGPARPRLPDARPAPPRGSARRAGGLPRLAPPAAGSAAQIAAWRELRRAGQPYALGGQPDACVAWAREQRRSEPAFNHGLLWSIESSCHRRAGDREQELEADRQACAEGVERSCVYLGEFGLR